MSDHRLSDMPVLTGYAYSTYTRSLRIALSEKGVRYHYVECDPFDPANALTLIKEHPFGRVPVLNHDGFRVWEAAAILDYVDIEFDGPALVPVDTDEAVRMRQVIAVVDNYAYWPLVRQAFSHGIFRPLAGEQADPEKRQAGLAAAPRILDALDEFAREGLVLRPGAVCLAACHLWPVLDYFSMMPEGQDLLAHRDALNAWMYWMGQRVSAQQTRPDLTALRPGAGGANV